MKNKAKIKLNHDCIHCKKFLYIGEGSLIEGKPQHFECFKREALTLQQEEFEKIIDEVARKGDDLHKDTGRHWIYVEELKEAIQKQ